MKKMHLAWKRSLISVLNGELVGWLTDHEGSGLFKVPISPDMTVPRFSKITESTEITFIDIYFPEIHKYLQIYLQLIFIPPPFFIFYFFHLYVKHS